MLGGFLSLNSDFAQPTPIKILRNTGASQSLILADTLPFTEKTSGTSVHLLLGNDLARDKVVVNPLVTDTSCMEQ